MGKKEQPPPFEQHYRVLDVAARLRVSPQTVRRLVKDRPGVLCIGHAQTTRTKRAYATLLIPESLLRELCNELR